MLTIPCMPATGVQAAESGQPIHCSSACQTGGRNLSAFVDIELARRNYLALAQGSKSPSQLSPTEAQEVRELIKLMEQNRKANESAYERCRNQQLGDRNPTELELRLIDLKCSNL